MDQLLSLKPQFRPFGVPLFKKFRFTALADWKYVKSCMGMILYRYGHEVTPKAPNKGTTKVKSAKIRKNVLSKLYLIENSKTSRQTLDPDEAGYYELSHLGLACLRIQLFSVLVLCKC